MNPGTAEFSDPVAAVVDREGVLSRFGPNERRLLADPWQRRLRRRAVMIPLYVLSLVFAIVASPLLAIACLGVDVARRRGLVLIRALALLLLYLAAEVSGIAAGFVLWLTNAGWRREPTERYLERNFALQCWWAAVLLRGCVRLFGLRVTVAGDDLLQSGPMLVFARHVSPLDNLIPAVTISGRHHIRLRWAINRSLLRDPCLDIVGNRLPNAFVRTGTDESALHTRTVGALASHLGPREGVLIFPEGALFSPARRARIVERLAPGSEARERATRLANVLPLRLGGSLALLDAADGSDAVFCAHTGLEAASDYRSFLSGELIGRELRIAFWRIPASSIPEGRHDRSRWLQDQWEAVDRWVTANREP